MDSDRPRIKSGLIFEQVDDELLIYDGESHQAICLNSVAACVFKGCNGNRTPAQLAEELCRYSDDPEERATATVAALDRLAEHNLLLDYRPSRRTFLRVALAPVIMAALAPEPAMAASKVCITAAACAGMGAFSCNPCDSLNRTPADCTGGNSYCMRQFAVNRSAGSCAGDTPRALVPFSCEPENANGLWHRSCVLARAYVIALDNGISDYKCCFC